jgi:hypothetical protein
MKHVFAIFALLLCAQSAFATKCDEVEYKDGQFTVVGGMQISLSNSKTDRTLEIIGEEDNKVRFSTTEEGIYGAIIRVIPGKEGEEEIILAENLHPDFSKQKTATIISLTASGGQYIYRVLQDALPAYPSFLVSCPDRLK